NGTFVAAAGGAAEQKAAAAAQSYAEAAQRLGLPRDRALSLAQDAVRAAYAR
ncbi:GntR family transcriptional regulator, partial [Streptomyces sp. SID8455]|nr:GntR family transcriptional regulator [Streptomyces sp. SID8455]